jgi:spore germination protein YaaH
MRKRASKINKKIVTIIAAIIAVLVIAVIAVINIVSRDDTSKTKLIINNNNVSERLKQEVIVEDDVIYLSMDDVKNFFDKYIYQDEDTDLIITTYEKKIASVKVDSKEITINGANSKMYATPIEKNGTIYLPISEMDNVYNVEVNYIEKTNRVTMDSLDREQVKAYVSKNVKVKSSTKLVSKKVEKLKKGSQVIYVSDTDDGYAKVRTEDGKLGYVKKSVLTNYVTVRDNMEEESQIEGKVNLVWDYFSEYSKAPNRNGTTIDGINVVSPSFFYIDKNGDFQENVGDDGKAYIEWAKNNGYKVWAMVSNSSAGIDTTSKIINSYTARQELIENIVNACVKYNLDGINVDFENMYQDDKDAYSRFIIELEPQLKDAGLVMSVDVTAPDGAETWSLCFDRNVIGHVADYIVFMAYDQYGTSSTKAGTTAGYNWIETNLKKFIETEEVDSQKIVLAVPFYTRLWTENGDKVTSKTVDMNLIDKVIPSSAEKVWDDTLKQYYVEYNDGSATKKMWIEDLESIKAKVSLISQYNLGGCAAWEKDREIEDVWSVIKEAIQ